MPYVEPCASEGPADRRQPLRSHNPIGVPEVVDEVHRRLLGRERVVAADGERDEDAQVLAVLDVVAHAAERVSREVEAVLAVAVDVEEGHDDDHGVHAGVAGLAEGTLLLVPAPEHGQLPGLVHQIGGGRCGDRNGLAGSSIGAIPSCNSRHCCT
jgi:hypothetical protein